jgi:hypothetical protein
MSADRDALEPLSLTFRFERARGQKGDCALLCLMSPNPQGSGKLRLRLFCTSKDLLGPMRIRGFGFRF